MHREAAEVTWLCLKIAMPMGTRINKIIYSIASQTFNLQSISLKGNALYCKVKISETSKMV